LAEELNSNNTLAISSCTCLAPPAPSTGHHHDQRDHGHEDTNQAEMPNLDLIASIPFGFLGAVCN
jgi:hypothetical protein